MAVLTSKGVLGYAITIVTTLTIGTGLYFATNNSADIGSSTSAVKDMYASGTAYMTNVEMDGTLVVGASSDATNYVYFGTADGCGAMVFSASDTTPTLTPTSSAFCY